MMTSVPEAAFAMDQHLPTQQPAEQEQLCYVHCKCCDTILAVGVPCSSFFYKTVTVRCGHCTNLLSVNLRSLLLPTAAASNQNLPFGGGQHQDLLSPTSPHGALLDEMAFQQAPSLTSAEPASACVSTITSINNSGCGGNSASVMSMAPPPVKPASQEPQLPKSAASGNKTEKRQRVPSAYNRFIKDEIQRIKASNPDITHREAFSAAAKNWAHFPHIHFGLMPDQGLKKTAIQNQEGAECMLFKDGLYAAAAAAASSMGIAPF